MDELGGMDMDGWLRSTDAIVLKHYQRLVGLETLDQSDEETWPDQQKTKIQVDGIYDTCNVLENSRWKVCMTYMAKMDMWNLVSENLETTKLQEIQVDEIFDKDGDNKISSAEFMDMFTMR